MFKIITKSLLKKKVSILFIIIQLTIINIAMYEMITTFNIIENQKVDLESILQGNTEKMINIEFNDLYPDKNFANKTIELNEYLNSQDQVEYAGGFSLTSIPVRELKNNSKFLEMQRKIYKGTKREYYIDVPEVMFLDRNMDKFLNLDVVQGQNFSRSDFNLKDGEMVPVLLGNKFKGILNIGDELNSYNLIGSEHEKVFIVIGFLKENSYSLNDSYFMENEKVNLDNVIIIPSYESNNKSTTSVVKKASSYFIYAKDESYIENISLNLKIEADKMGLNVECNTFNKLYKNYKEDNDEIQNIIGITIIFLFVITVFSITSTMLIAIRKRKRELGIRIVTGASKSNIRKIFLYEIILVTIISNIISIIYIIHNNYVDSFVHTCNIMQVINIKSLICILVFTLLIVIVSSFIPLRRIGKLQPKELIGGNE